MTERDEDAETTFSMFGTKIMMVEGGLLKITKRDEDGKPGTIILTLVAGSPPVCVEMSEGAAVALSKYLSEASVPGIGKRCLTVGGEEAHDRVAGPIPEPTG